MDTIILLEVELVQGQIEANIRKPRRKLKILV